MKDRACGIVARNNKLLFIEQWYAENDLRHVFVGGGVEENETPEQAVLRELKEEANASGEIRFGPVTISDSRRTEHLFVIEIPDTAMPSAGHDPEFPPDRQVITNVLWYDADENIDRFTDIDMTYFTVLLEEAEREKVEAEWMYVLRRVMANYRRA